jgi:predicted transcriptional regulator
MARAECTIGNLHTISLFSEIEASAELNVSCLILGGHNSSECCGINVRSWRSENDVVQQIEEVRRQFKSVVLVKPSS